MPRALSQISGHRLRIKQPTSHHLAQDFSTPRRLVMFLRRHQAEGRIALLLVCHKATQSCQQRAMLLVTLQSRLDTDRRPNQALVLPVLTKAMKPARKPDQALILPVPTRAMHTTLPSPVGKHPIHQTHPHEKRHAVLAVAAA